MISSISPVCVNRSYAPNFKGAVLQRTEVSQTKPEENSSKKILEQSRKNARDGIIFGGLLTLVAGAIVFWVTRGKEKGIISKAANDAANQSRKVRGKVPRPIIKSNLPEAKKCLSKIQQKVDGEWKLLETLPSGSYVKKGQSYVPAANSDANYIVIDRISDGTTCVKIFNKKREKFIAIDE